MVCFENLNKMFFAQKKILIPIFISIWLVALLEVFRQFGSSGSELELAFISVTLIFPYLPNSDNVKRLVFINYNVLSLLWIAIILSMVSNAAESSQIVYGGNISILFYLALLLKHQSGILRSVCQWYSILGAIWITTKTYNAEHLDGRLFADGIHPNWWGNMALGIAVAGLSWHSKLIQLIPISVGLYISYLASSRASGIAILAGVGVFYFMKIKSRGVTGLGLFVAIIVVVICCLATAMFWEDLTAFVNEVFLLDSSDRGVGSGMSGRTELWAESISKWLKSPVFGNGYKTNPEAHNSLLMMLSETGIIGAFSWCLLWVLIFIRTLSRRYRTDECNPVFTAIAGSYFLSGITHPTAININPTSIVFIISGVRYMDFSFRSESSSGQNAVVVK
jgi:O-antigen ligase